MENKIKRFIELSREFTKDAEEVYEGFKVDNTGDMHINGNFSIGTGNGYITTAQTYSQITDSKAEQFEKSQLEKINKVKRYEEYLELQTSLSEYYNALNKLNNK